MAQIWKPRDPVILKGWVETILEEASDTLNSWELDFITDIQTKLEKGWRLTERQEAKLETIYAEKTK